MFGGSWGTTLGILYAETHPDRVTDLILSGVTTTRPRELDWLYRGGVAPLLPEQWARFRAGVPVAERDGDLIEAYHRLLHDPDPETRAQAADGWCRWETATGGSGPGPALAGRFANPAYALAFARIVIHYFRDAAWLEDRRLLRDTGMHLRHRPFRPNNYQLQDVGRKFPPNHLHETWMDYLYWDVELEG